MTDEGREAQSKSDRRPASAGNRPDPAAPAAGRPTVRPPSAATPPPAATPPSAIRPIATPPNVGPYAAGPVSRPVAPPFEPARSQYASPADLRAAGPQSAAGQDDFDDDEELEAEEPPRTLAERIRTLQPAPVIMTIGSIGALVFLGRAVTSHTTPVPVLLSAGVVSCIVFAIDAGVATVGTLRSSREGRLRRALLLSAVGGVAALISAGAFSGVLIMVLVLNT